jgi:CubicO group peptidase (beta-lactamase class C family)
MTRLFGLAAAFAASTALCAAPLAASLDGVGGYAGQPGETAGVDAHAGEAAMLKEAMSLADYWLENYRLYKNIPAISAAVVRDQNTVWAKGFGHTDRAGKKAASADTIYSICSISKLFTSVAFMQQWEKGAVRLDEPVATYLPWAVLAPDDRDSVPVTMRALLTHSAGLPREAVQPYWTGPDFPFPTQAQVRDGIGGQHPLYPVSQTFQYSNLGLTLVGETVEAVSGTPYGDYVTANILKPLELDHTRPFIPADLYGKDMAVGWGALEPDGTRPPVKLFDARGINPAAGYSSTVKDLAKFAQWQFRVLDGGKPELLRASTLREMHRVQYITPDRETSWGLGFVSYRNNGRNLVGHGGSCPGYRSSLMMDPAAKTAVVVAMNAMDNPGLLARQIGALLAKRADAKPFDAPETGPVDLSQYAGVYDGQPWGADFAIVPWSQGLAGLEADANDVSENLWRLKPLGNDRFRVVTDQGEERDVVTFHRKADGSISHLERFGNFTYFSHKLD